MWLVVVERTKVGWTTSRKLERVADAEDEVHALVLVDGLMVMQMRMRMILICMRLTDERDEGCDGAIMMRIMLLRMRMRQRNDADETRELRVATR